ncbi:MAG: MFS transporter [Rubrivivax sp.]|nr:MFS transporter [Burkholderiales bacterium]
MSLADAPPETEPRQAWVVVWACFTALAVIFGVSYSFAAFFEPLQQQFAATRADVSMLFGVSGLIYFVLGAGAGMLADRFGPRVVTSLGMLFIAGGLLGASFAASLLGVIVAYGLGLGIGIGLVYTPAIACVQPWFTRRRGMAAGLASAGIGAGTLAGPLLVTALLAWSDWRVTLRVVAAVVLLMGLAATLLLQRAPAATAGARAVAGTPLGQALASPSYRWLYAMALLASPGMFIPFAHASAAARDLGIDELRAVGLVGLIGVGSLAGRFVIGSFADRIGRARTLVLMQASLGLSFLLWAFAGGYAAMAVFAVWMGLSYGGIVSLMPAFVMDRFGARAVSSLVGILYTGAALGNLGGPVLAGAVFDQSGSYQGVIWACVALSALATFAAARATGWRVSDRADAATVRRRP